MTYHQLTSEERYMLSAGRRQGLNQAQIARQLGRHRSTIGRELKRNSSRWDGNYRPSKAIERTHGRRSRSRRNQRFTAEELHCVEALLRQQWSPEQVSGLLRRQQRLRISHETIYRHVWHDRRCGGNLHEHLRGARKRRFRKRYRSYDSRGRLAGKRHLSERPAAVAGRRQLLTVVDDCTHEAVAVHPDRAMSGAYVARILDRLKHERGLPKVIRSDNVLNASRHSLRGNSNPGRPAAADRRRSSR